MILLSLRGKIFFNAEAPSSNFVLKSSIAKNCRLRQSHLPFSVVVQSQKRDQNRQSFIPFNCQVRQLKGSVPERWFFKKYKTFEFVTKSGSTKLQLFFFKIFHHLTPSPVLQPSEVNAGVRSNTRFFFIRICSIRISG